MKTWEGTKLEICFNVAGEEKQRKQPINNVIKEPTEKQIKDFGALIGQLAPVEDRYHSVIETKKERYIV